MNLHAIWFESSLHLWGTHAQLSAEDTAVNAHDAPLRLMDPAELRAAVGEMSADALLGSIATESSLHILLPTPSGFPLREPHEQLPPHPDTPTPRYNNFSPTTVPTMLLSPADAIDLLTSLRPAAPIDSQAMDSLSYWATLARFIIAHIAKQQFFPDLVPVDDQTLRATWRLLATTVGPLERFAQAMPPVCRAIDPQPEPPALVESFLIAATDAVIRRDLARDPFFATFHQRTDLPNVPEVRWLRALMGDNAFIIGTPLENRPLLELVKTWTRPLDRKGTTPPVQVRFTLMEPEESDEPEVANENKNETENAPTQIAAPTDISTPWILQLGILPLERESTVIDAAELWAKDVPLEGVLSRTTLEWRTRFLAELARAAQICPLLERALLQPEPAQVALTTTEAHAFISQWAAALREQSFSVDLPLWCQEETRALGLVLHLQLPGGFDNGDGPTARSGVNVPNPEITVGKFGLNTLLDFNWRVALGGMEISTEEFRTLAQQHVPLVKFRDRWLQLPPDVAAKALEFFESKTEKRMTLAQAFRAAYASDPAGLRVLGLSGSGSIKAFLDGTTTAQLEHLPQPESFLGTLRPYQLRGLEWMAFLESLGIGGCLADDMGLGKTIQLIALLLHERKTNPTCGPTLLFAPTSVVANWVRELERFSPELRVLVYHGAQRIRGDAFVSAVAQHDVVLTSYALAHRDLADLRRAKWHRVALDEAQKIKNPSAAASLAIRCIESNNRVALTGTPIENHLSELWSIMEMLNPGLLGSAGEFRSRFAVPIEKLGDQDRAAQLRKMIQPFVLRRTKSDPAIAGDLPEKMENRVYCNLTPAQAALYEATTADMLGQIDAATGIRRRGLILAALTRLKQICDHPALLQQEPDILNGRSGKCERLVEMLEEVIEEGDSALVFTQYRTMGHLLEKILNERLGQKLLYLHGGTPARDRQTMVETFQAPKSDHRIFILSLRAGGLGLNLTAANHVFHFDRWWNPAVEAQATDRAHRIGQTKKVQVHKFICVGTLEERIDRLLSDKIAVASQVVTSGDQWLTNLSTDDLRSYLTLSEEAVGDFT